MTQTPAIKRRHAAPRCHAGAHTPISDNGPVAR